MIPFLVWSVLYSLYSFFVNHLSLKLILKKFIFFDAAIQLYFIALIIQYYILIPILRKLANSKKGIISAFLISISSTFAIEFVKFKLKINLPTYLYAGSFTTWLIFPVMGMYISRSKIKNTIFYFFSSIFFLFISFVHSKYLISNFNDIDNAISAVKPSSFLYSISMIFFLFSIRSHLNFSNWLTKIGVLSFGIYFSHVFFLFIFIDFLKNNFSRDFFSQFYIQIIGVILILISSSLLGVLIKKVFPSLANKFFGY